MNYRTGVKSALLLAIMAILGLVIRATPPEGEKTAKSSVPLAVAKDRARLLHEVYTSTLEVIHQRYFRNERTMVPARAMEEIFSDMQRNNRGEARWMSVNLKAMSINHEPKTEFEKRAAKEIADGKTEVEVVEDGFYRRAGVIPLGVGCIGCHDGFFKPPTKDPKFAALVISVPVSK